MAKNENELLEQLLNNVGDEYDKTAGYIVYDMLKSIALVLSGQLERLDGVERLLDVDNLSGSLLEAFVRQRKGIVRNPATYARGTLHVTGNGTVETGDLFETPSGVQFSAVETKVISGTGTIIIQSIVPGVSGNVPANQITQMPVTISGITAVTNTEPAHDGYDAETDESLRERYYIAVRTPPTSGNVYHYQQWASEVAGVGGVKVFPVERGENTVEIVILDQVKQPASPVLVTQVQEHIDPGSEGLGNGEAPIGARCYVVSAAALTIDISVSISRALGYTESEVLANVESSIREYLKTIAFRQNYVSFARIGESILNSEGVEDYSGLLVNGVAENPSIAVKEVAVLGVVTFA